MTQDTQSAISSGDTSAAERQSADIAYTINHALACTAVDWVGQTPMLIALQKSFGVRNPKHIGCNNPFHTECHTHGDHDHDMSEAASTLSEEENALHKQHVKTLGKVFGAAEVVGDFGGIFPTVMMQRYTPWAMDGIRPVLRTTLGPVFHWGAERSSTQWAKEHGVEKNSPEYKAHLNKLYEHEMHYLPQAAWWTAWSSAFNLALQQPFYERLATPAIREEFPLGNISQRAVQKVAGAGLSIGLVLGTRALFPETAHRFTNWTEDTLVTPTTKVFTRMMGIDDKTVDKVIAERQEFHGGHMKDRHAGEEAHHAVTDGSISR